MTMNEIREEIEAATNQLARLGNNLTGNSKELSERMASGILAEEEWNQISESHKDGGSGKLTRDEFQSFQEIYARLARLHNSLIAA